MYSIVLTRVPFDFYLAYLGFLMIIALAFIVKPGLRLPIKPIGVVALFLILQFFVTNSVGSVFPRVVQQVVLIGFTLLVMFLAFQATGFDLNRIFKVYYNTVLIVSALIIFQQVAYQLNLSFIYDLSWILNNARIESTTFGMMRTGGLVIEPSHFIYVSFPAVYFALNRIIGNERNHVNSSLSKAIIMVAGFMLTFSSIGIIGLFIYLVIRASRKSLPKFLLGMVVISLLAIVAYSYIPFLRMRVDDTFKFSMNVENIQKTDNWSTYALLSNAFVTYRSLEENPLFGAGIGNHVFNHGKYLSEIVTMTGPMFSLNKEDANSMLLRLLSEVGILGFLVVVYFLFRFKIKRSDAIKTQNLFLFAVNDGVFIMLLLKLIRDGHYAVNGFLFFVLLYYYSYRQLKVSKST